MSRKPTVIDCVLELEALEETWKGAQERAAIHLTLMTDALAAATPILPAGRRLRKSVEHSLCVLIELNSVTVGLMAGLMSLFKEQVAYQKEQNRGEGTPD